VESTKQNRPAVAGRVDQVVYEKMQPACQPQLRKKSQKYHRIASPLPAAARISAFQAHCGLQQGRQIGDRFPRPFLPVTGTL